MGIKRTTFIAAPILVVAGILAALTGAEGRKLVPYYDIAGVLTVCDGITGPGVIKGRTYTNAECDSMGQVYVRRMLENMGQCVRGEFEPHEIKAWGHFAYNVGTGAFCKSTAAKRLNAGERKAACAEISKWTFVAGKDCRVAANKCGGIVKRRDWERATCEGKNP